jgi:hypothetical protein
MIATGTGHRAIHGRRALSRYNAAPIRASLDSAPPVVGALLRSRWPSQQRDCRGHVTVAKQLHRVPMFIGEAGLEQGKTLSQIARGLTWIGAVFLVASAAVIVWAVFRTVGVDDLIVALTVAGLGLGLPAVVAFVVAWVLNSLGHDDAEAADQDVVVEAPARIDVASVALRYGVAVFASIATWALRATLDPLLGQQVPYAPLLLAVAFSAWFGGLVPAVAISGAPRLVRLSQSRRALRAAQHPGFGATRALRRRCAVHWRHRVRAARVRRARAAARARSADPRVRSREDAGRARSGARPVARNAAGDRRSGDRDGCAREHHVHERLRRNFDRMADRRGRRTCAREDLQDARW